MEMGRPKTAFPDLPPRMVGRSLKTKTLYYYHRADGGKTPLGSDLNSARLKWAEIENGASVATFGSAAERFRAEHIPSLSPKTQREYLSQLKRLEPFFPAPLSAIKTPHLRAYLAKRSAKVAANREVALFSAIFNFAKSWGMTEVENPCTVLPRNPERPRDRYVADEEYREVMGRAGPELQDAMDLSLLTGQRLSDVLNMKRTDIKDGYLWVKQSKTRKPMGIQVSGELAAVIQRILGRTRKATGAFLVQTDSGQRLTYSMLRKRFLKARGASTWWFADLRPKASSDSPTLQEAQSLLGHESAVTTKRHYRRGERVKPLR